MFTTEDESDDYWSSSAGVESNLGTYDAEGQRVIQVLGTLTELQYAVFTLIQILRNGSDMDCWLLKHFN